MTVSAAQKCLLEPPRTDQKMYVCWRMECRVHIKRPGRVRHKISVFAVCTIRLVFDDVKRRIIIRLSCDVAFECEEISRR